MIDIELVAFAAALVGTLVAAINLRTARLNARAAKPTTTETRGMDPKPGILLPPRPQLINRSQEMRFAVSRIRDGGSVLAIEGGIGTGKSATAYELVHRLRNGRQPLHPRSSLRDHAFVWIDAADECPSMVDICRQLTMFTGDQRLSMVRDDEKLEALRVHLADRKTVLLLDNVRVGDDPESEALRRFLRAVPTGSLVIASVNRSGPLDVPRVLLEELQLDHMHDLIRQQVRRLDLEHAGDFNEGFARRLHDVIGGNPRMIEWFLLAFSKGHLSLDERLAALEAGDGLRELFEPVWNDLGERCRAVLGACAYLRGQATCVQLSIASGLTKPDVGSMLDELARSGLVSCVHVAGQESLYTCAPGLRRFVLAATEPLTVNAFTQRLASHYTRYFGVRWEDARGAIPHITALRVVIEELHGQANNAKLQPLFAVTHDLFLTLGLCDDRIALGQLAHDTAVHAEDYRAASVAASVISSTRALRGQFAQAREGLALGLLAAEQSGDRGEVARQMRDTGFINYRSAQPQEALEAIEGAEEMAREAGDLRNVVDILGVRMSSYLYLGDIEKAQVAATRCLEVCDEIPWGRAKSYPLRHLAEIAIHRRQFRQARSLLEDARLIAAEHEDRRELARNALTEARLRLYDGHPWSAWRAAALAEVAARSLGLPPETSEAKALHFAARRATFFVPLARRYARERPLRLTDAAVGGD